MTKKMVDEEEGDETSFWSRYTPEQRAYLEKAFDESLKPDNWVSHEDVMKKYERCK